MLQLQVQADFAFADVYLATLLLLQPQANKRDVNQMVCELSGCPPERLAAAREALWDFKQMDIQLTRLSQCIDDALKRLELAGL